MTNKELRAKLSAASKEIKQLREAYQAKTRELRTARREIAYAQSLVDAFITLTNKR